MMTSRWYPTMTGRRLAPSRLVVEWVAFICVLVLTVVFYISVDHRLAESFQGEDDCTDEDCKHGKSENIHTHTHIISKLKPKLPQPCGMGVREDHLANVCENWKTIRHIRFQDPGTYWAMFVDDQHKVLYCIVPKAGCTSFQTMIVNSTGKLMDNDEMAVHDPEVLRKLNFKYLHEYPFEEIIWRLEHYFKFLVVRHPFERLYSAYIDKIRTAPYFKEKYGRIIKKHFPKHDPKDNSHPLSMPEFLELVAKEYDTGYKDRHWATIDEICHPCDIKYDYVAKLETLSEDLPNLLPKFASKNGSVPNLHVLHRKHGHNHTKVKDKFKSVPAPIMRRIYSLYQMDFQLFGYSWINNTAGNCSVPHGDNLCC